MDVRARLDGLMRLSFAEIGALPDSSALGAVDDDGKKYQLVTWRELLEPDMQRVKVSRHMLHGLGFCSLRGALGFTINATGKIELLDPKGVETLLL